MLRIVFATNPLKVTSMSAPSVPLFLAKRMVLMQVARRCSAQIARCREALLSLLEKRARHNADNRVIVARS